MNAHEIDLLFEQYLEICNRAMDTHRQHFPYKQIWEAVERMKADDEIELTIYDDTPQSHYKVRLKDKHIELLETDHADEKPKGWKMNTSYLRRVVEHPEEYIAHPAMLDWDWLKNRAGF